MLTANGLADLRADLARAEIPLYVLAPLVGLHPNHLGKMLRGRQPMPPVIAERLRLATEQVRSGGPDVA